MPDEDDGDVDVEELEDEVEVAMRYLYTCGITAWYWANRAKSRAVGPAGR